MDKENQILQEKIRSFIIESLPIVKKIVDIGSLPTLKRYYIQKKDGNVKIIPHNRPNWYQVRGLRELKKLQSFQELNITIYSHKQISSLDGKQLFALSAGCPFNVSEIPFEFLVQFIFRGDSLKFNQKIFDNLFNDFIEYINLNNTFKTRVIVPLDNLLITPKVVELDSNYRIRSLGDEERIDIINNNPILGFFYGTSFSLWFRCILEFDMSYHCSWTNSLEFENNEQDFCIPPRNIGNELHYRMTKINQEIVILRSILNLPISSPISVIDYRGWNSDTFKIEPIIKLPWLRHQVYGQDRLSLKEVKKYKKIRKKFIEIKNRKTQQQIFVAMRKLAFSFDRAYGGDEIMELVSGLEGLLVNSKNEIGHQFAERIALLLASDPLERKLLFNDMKRAYKFRSLVAHGSIIADELDSIIANATSQIDSKGIKDFNEIQRLRPRIRNSLHKAILICINDQTTEFDWDSAIMSAHWKP